MGLVVSEGPHLASVNADEVDLVAQLRAGDERAFEALVERSHATMIAVARRYVKTRDVAEEVVQETWLHVLHGLDRFEGRSALKTWILRILVNTAITRAGRESRSLPFSSLARADEEAPAVDPDRFMAPGEPFAGNWARAPGDWRALPEEDL